MEIYGYISTYNNSMNQSSENINEQIFGPCSPLRIRLSSILMAHKSSELTHFDQFIRAGLPERGGRSDQFDLTSLSLINILSLKKGSC
jgi:hypothetical protein